MSILEIQNVSKSFGRFKAVDKVSFTVQAGQIHGLLGPNGAGKTTTIRMIMNIILPDEGHIRLFGQAMNEELKTKIGYLPEERGIYPKMRVRELLVFLGELHGISRSLARLKSQQWLQKLEIGHTENKKVEELSKGMQQKLQFIGTILHDPELLILDEPFSGLDPVNVNLLKDIMLDFKAQGKAIVFSTHMMDAAERLCDEIVMIDHGKKVLDGSLSAIKNQYGKDAIHIEYKGDGNYLKKADIIHKLDDYGNYAELELKEGVSLNAFFSDAIKHLEVIKIDTRKSSLNEIFISLAGEGEDHE